MERNDSGELFSESANLQDSKIKEGNLNLHTQLNFLICLTKTFDYF